ncbi:HlyD family secretion protein [Vibrio vulnificus]|uniref:HlyD family secretion protein n=1 Tax=Vibrio TaxID=662 RepID=UPI001A22618B|nr:MULTISPECIES: efflux RND transporter periplasmic adaptor subunit [Vibrio]EJR3608024.1 HlyD family secretion protein [Vibrio vulnificus]EJV9308670.1 HlyD family secretion protein [Vibrio vulnificus]ELK2252916.1 HlyD family secretion protein [Vibrio vulnificus]ELS3447605.1 HlyD family secretion protein [Vibrio vulnificus]ELS9097096.1 HlyD family secretion protein [Vibrio vulnificus]
MIEGLAVWALFIYLLRMVGMPWNKGTKAFAYMGGVSWLMFVWVGLINFTPMDISGGSVVQSPHIQLRPDSSNVNGKVEKIYISPNQEISKGQLIYQLDDTPYQIALNQAKVTSQAAQVALKVAQEDIAIAQASHEAALQDLETSKSQLAAAKADHQLQAKTLTRYVEQNRVVKNTITQNDIDKQTTAVELAKQNIATLQSSLKKKEVDASRAKLDITKAELAVETRTADLAKAKEQVARTQWDLDSTLVYAPADGFVTNFILREGQRVSMMPRLQMYTNEKYVLMRVNHQAIRNVKPGQMAEFASSVYPGKIFSAEVEGIVEATGEAQGNLLGWDDSVRMTTGKNLANKHHFVRLKIDEPEGYDLPVGSVGLAWVSGEKPIGFLAFLDVIRGIIIRMKSQLYFFYSI